MADHGPITSVAEDFCGEDHSPMPAEEDSTGFGFGIVADFDGDGAHQESDDAEDEWREEVGAYSAPPGFHLRNPLCRADSVAGWWG